MGKAVEMSVHPVLPRATSNWQTLVCQDKRMSYICWKNKIIRRMSNAK